MRKEGVAIASKCMKAREPMRGIAVQHAGQSIAMSVRTGQR